MGIANLFENAFGDAIAGNIAFLQCYIQGITLQVSFQKDVIDGELC